MKNVYEVLRQKELEVSRLEKEVEALRVAPASVPPVLPHNVASTWYRENEHL
jgi:hypothetical protein